MKMILAILFSLSAYASPQNTPKADDMKIITRFTNYACKSFRDKSKAPDQINDLKVEIIKMGIASNTRRAIIDVKSLDKKCTYHADYSRQKGFTVLNFEDSSITPDSPRCLELKANLDEIFFPGFKYIIKFNNYVSMLFLKDLTGPCDDVSGNHLIEFAWL